MTLAQNQDRLRKWGFLTDPSGGYGPNTEAAYTKALDKLETFLPLVPAVGSSLFPNETVAPNVLSVRGACEVIEHEAIVLEWYKDSKGIGTWGIGVTNRSGHNVDRYKDNPQTVKRVLDIYVWLLKTGYLPDVLRAFSGFPLNEHQLSAILSFHYNTGSILKTDLVKFIRSGDEAAARAFWTSHYLNDGTLTKRRKMEAALFYDAAWTTDGKATVYEVKKPSYTPDWGSAKQVDIIPALTAAMKDNA